MTAEEFEKIRRDNGHLTPRQSTALIEHATQLHDALEWIIDCWGRDQDDYYRADMQEAIENGKKSLRGTP
jgi:hypothetical protein